MGLDETERVVTAQGVVAFVTARLDEWERTALDATAGPWSVVEPGVWASAKKRDVSGPGDHYVTFDDGDEGASSPADAAHIAQHDPARVLREIAAMRAIVAIHGPGHRCPNHLEWDEEPCDTLKHLAAVWSEHADYRAEWAP